MENSFSNINIDFALNSDEHKKLLTSFDSKIKKKARWVKLLDESQQLYLMRMNRNRRFFYFKSQHKIITSEHVIAWNKLIENGVKPQNIAKVYHLDLNMLKTCLYYYKQEEKTINKSRILL